MTHSIPERYETFETNCVLEIITHLEHSIFEIYNTLETHNIFEKYKGDSYLCGFKMPRTAFPNQSADQLVKHHRCV